MSASQPPRRFKPEPVETTTRSSASKTPRRFEPIPIETSFKSARDVLSPKDHPTEEGCDNVFRAPGPKKPRKFAVEPVETSHVSSKDKDGAAKENKPRRFAPQPVETTHISSKGKAAAGDSRPRPRFAPQLIETSEKSSNQRRHLSEGRSDSPMSSTTSSARKFTPELIETAKRSRKAGEEGPAVPHSDRTDAFRNQRHKPQPTANDPLEHSPYGAPKSVSAEVAEARRLGKPVPKRQGSADSIRSRSHSFYVPDLDPIESSESDRSEDERDSSMSTSPSVGSEAASSSKLWEHATRARESVDGRSSGYLLELAARAAEKQMREQALAAFPNDDRHQRVDHYMDKDDDDMSDAWSVADGGSTDGRYLKINWEMREMQKHASGKAAAKEKDRLRKEAWRNFNKKASANGPWGDAAAALYSAAGEDRKGMIGEWQEQVGLAQMRKSARPPMLGKDIKFPRCPSPEPARFDVTQGSEAIRQKMCYLSEQSENDKPKITLWGTANKPSSEDDCAALWMKYEDKPAPKEGLWGGFCTGTGMTPPRGPTGLMTPFLHPEDQEAMEAHKRGPHQLPPSPPASNSGMSGLDEKLELEKAIEEEFDDAFVTQVYNYLSLGYPSMARKFDSELAKISRIELTELRADDAIAGAGARGYIRLGEENGIPAVDEDGNEVKEEHCARWRALRSYVREWARQQPTWQTNQYGGGVTARRGSWGW